MEEEVDDFVPVCPNCGRKMRKRMVRGGAMGSFETYDCPFCQP